MCSVIGYQPVRPTIEGSKAFRRLFDESRIRGTHAYGLAELNYGELRVFRTYNWEEVPQRFHADNPTIAHTRYCQSGDWQDMANNQPLVVGNMALAMNGVIHMGTKEEYEEAFDVQCNVDNDSEIFLQKLARGEDAEEFIESITGSFAATWLKDGKLWAGRNARRPLWVCSQYGAIWYASTNDIFQRAGFEGAVSLTPNAVRCSS